MAKAKTAGRLQLKKDLPLLFLCLPGVIYLIINNYMPMFGLFIAFKDINYAKGIFGSDWAGLKNFRIPVRHQRRLYHDSQHYPV